MEKKDVMYEFDLTLEGLKIELGELTDSMEDIIRSNELNDLRDLVVSASSTYESLYDNESDLLCIILDAVESAKERREVRSLDDNK